MEVVHELKVARGDAHYLKKSADQKAQITKVYRQLQIFQSVFITPSNLTHKRFIYFQSFLLLNWFIFNEKIV